MKLEKLNGQTINNNNILVKAIGIKNTNISVHKQSKNKNWEVNNSK